MAFEAVSQRCLQAGRLLAAAGGDDAALERTAAVIAHLLERHQRGEAGLPLLELLQAVGALPASVRRKQELEREDLNRYKSLGRLLNDLEGVVAATRMPADAQGYCLSYGLNGAGASLKRTSRGIGAF